MPLTLAPIGEGLERGLVGPQPSGLLERCTVPTLATSKAEDRRNALAKGFHLKSRELRGFSMAKRQPDALQASTIRLVA